MLLCRATMSSSGSTSVFQSVRNRNSSLCPSVHNSSLVYFNSLLATLNARGLFRDGKYTRSVGGYSGSTGAGAYPMPRVVAIGSASDARKSLGSSPPSSPAHGEFELAEKVRFSAKHIWQCIAHRQVRLDRRMFAHWR